MRNVFGRPSLELVAFLLSAADALTWTDLLSCGLRLLGYAKTRTQGISTAQTSPKTSLQPRTALHCAASPACSQKPTLQSADNACTRFRLMSRLELSAPATTFNFGRPELNCDVLLDPTLLVSLFSELAHRFETFAFAMVYVSDLPSRLS